MNKILSSLLLVSIFAIGCNSGVFAQNLQPPTSPNMLRQNPKEAMRRQFEQRLNLTDKQKEKARQIHKQGREEIAPIMMKIEVRRQEIETVRLTKMVKRAQDERIEEINAEIKELEKQAQEVRRKNSQEFESILNKKQKAELEKMKAEGRARFEQNHPARAPFGGLGTPVFFFKPLLPPPENNGFWK